MYYRVTKILHESNVMNLNTQKKKKKKIRLAYGIETKIPRYHIVVSFIVENINPSNKK